MSSPLTTTTSFAETFDAFVQSYIDHSTQDNMGLVTYFDKAWMSPCFKIATIGGSEQVNNRQIGEQVQAKEDEDGDEVTWTPFLRDSSESLSNLEEALEITIPVELQQLFCRYYSHDLNATSEHGKLTILQVWNEEDFDRLQKNLIAHVLMKRRLKQEDTLFFALTDEDDFILSVMLSTGAVMLEKVGKTPQREIASSLQEFIAELSPAPEFVSL